MNPTAYLGKAGEMAVASQLLLRGLNVHFPIVDNGVDIVTSNGIRIQVKSARRGRSNRANRSFGYIFNIAFSKWDSGQKKFYKESHSHQKVDFYVFWGSDENRFWVVPAPLLKTNMVRIVEDSNRYSVDYAAITALVDTGLDQRTVALKLGISEMSVSRAANGKFPKTKPGVCQEILKREGAWHEIISAVGLVAAINKGTEKETTVNA